MLKVLYDAPPAETPFSLLATLATTTLAREIRDVALDSFRRVPQRFQTSPCSLAKFCSLTEDFYGKPPQVLWERTLFPLDRGCMAADIAAFVESSACAGARRRLPGPRLPVPLHSVNRYGVECPECTESIRPVCCRRCSLSFHCIPLQTRCPLHGCRYQLADPCSAEEFQSLAQLDRERKYNSIRLSVKLLQMMEPHSARYWVVKLEQTLRAKGYVSESGRVKMAALNCDFLAYYSGGFEDNRLTFWLTRGSIPRHVMHCLPRSCTSPHPIEVALLDIALEDIEFSRFDHVFASSQSKAQSH